MEALIFSNKSVSWDDLSHLVVSPGRLKISSQTKKLIKISKDVLKDILKKGQLIYGVNTGFGKLSSVFIDQSDIKQLQLNLVRSHAAGIGSPFNIGIVRVAMALKILTWSKGYSGVRPKLVNQLIAMLNKDIITKNIHQIHPMVLLFLSSLWAIGELILTQTPFFWIGISDSLVSGDLYLAGLARWIGASGLCVLQLIFGIWYYFIFYNFKNKKNLFNCIFYGLLVNLTFHLLGYFLILPDVQNDSKYPLAITIFSFFIFVP